MFGRKKGPKCIGCGFCCKSGPCLAAVLKHGISTFWKWDKSCPELHFDGQRYWCRVHHIRKAWLLLSSGPDGDRCIMPENPARFVMLHGPIPTIPLRDPDVYTILPVPPTPTDGLDSTEGIFINGPPGSCPPDIDGDDVVLVYGSPFWPGWKEPPR